MTYYFPTFFVTKENLSFFRKTLTKVTIQKYVLLLVSTAKKIFFRRFEFSKVRLQKRNIEKCVLRNLIKESTRKVFIFNDFKMSVESLFYITDRALSKW